MPASHAFLTSSPVPPGLGVRGASGGWWKLRGVGQRALVGEGSARSAQQQDAEAGLVQVGGLLAVGGLEEAARSLGGP